MPPASAIAFLLSSSFAASICSAPAAYCLASAGFPVLSSSIRGAMPPAQAIAFLLSALRAARFCSAAAAIVLASADSPVLSSSTRGAMPPTWAITFRLSAFHVARLCSSLAAFTLAASSPTVKVCTSHAARSSAATSFVPFSVAASNGVFPAWHPPCNPCCERSSPQVGGH
eukprot:1187709-Prorocentrum_minimum.AAC.1